MPKWEYQIIGFDTNSTPPDELAKKLNAWGLDGWDIVSVGWPSHSFVLLKRKIG